MQKFIFTILVLSGLFFIGCSSDNEQINKSDLEKLITDAISGNKDANLTLQGFLSSNHIGKKDYNQLFIDELKTDDKTYFSVILEYSDSRLNLFGIYDDNLNFYILDRSLNGYLNSKWVQDGSREFVFLQERFLTKDVLSIDRLSIYEVGDSKASLIYRSPSRFVKDNNLAYQRVESITKNFILTKITGTNDAAIDNQIDTFYFKSGSKNYLSDKNLFDNYVYQEINNFIWISTKPQLTEGFNETDTETEIDTLPKGFKISLSQKWKNIPKYVESDRIKQSLVGVKYFDDSNGSSFTILEIPRGEEGEKYSPYVLTETKKGHYRIRASVIFEVGNNYLQIFEHTCGNTKYLMIFECPRSVYPANKKTFSDIIDSFSIDC